MSGLNLFKLVTDGKVDNREVIINYLTEPEGSVVLSEFQRELLKRWNYADDLMRSNVYSIREVEEMLVKKFEYSINTARNDVYDARTIFGTTRPVNKKYLLLIHAGRIEEMMIMAGQDGDFKNYAALAKEYTNAIKELPDDSKKKPAPTAIIFNLPAGIVPNINEDAAKKILIEQGFTDFIELKDE